MSEIKTRFRVLALLIFIYALILPFAWKPAIEAQTALVHSSYECSSLYFLNGIIVFNSTLDQELVLETPTNISLNEGFEQVVQHILSYNLIFNEEIKAFTFRVEANRSFEGFFISRVDVCYREMAITLSALLSAYYAPSYTLPTRGETPADVYEKYVRPPHVKVIEVVLPAYERWFKNKYKIDFNAASKLGIASTASHFIYRLYINYSAESIPRTIEEVIGTRRGDCDDMSRVLVELLNYFEIPSVIVGGYVYLPDFNYTSSIESVTYKFINNGPHAFTMAYLNEIGWISLDWLAGSLLAHPFIVEGYSRETSIQGQAIAEFVELHKLINATQVIAVFTEEELKREIGLPITLVRLREYFLKQAYGVEVVLREEESPQDSADNVEAKEDRNDTTIRDSPLGETDKTSTDVGRQYLEELLLGALLLIAFTALLIALGRIGHLHFLVLSLFSSFFGVASTS